MDLWTERSGYQPGMLLSEWEIQQFLESEPDRPCYMQLHPFKELDGSIGYTYFEDQHDLRPFVSFQVYVTYDRSWTSDRERDEETGKLGHEIFDEMRDPMGQCPDVRLDIHYLGSQADMIAACVRHYNAAKKAYVYKPKMMIPPSYDHHESERGRYHGFLITVPRHDWKTCGGLGMLYFDRVDAIGDVENESRQEDTRYVYPTRRIGPDTPIEHKLAQIALLGYGPLWDDISFPFSGAQSDWDDLWWEASFRSEYMWGRNEVAKRKAREKAGEAPVAETEAEPEVEET